ncbi:MAG: amino acid permease [Nitrosopumilus sp.]|uniref:APC family permease n=1 Tax=Nitrosopumilus sp. TaxID=2024843 RepID=UPI00247EB57A|nr:amino acid permease [Nitrosopumilus sp.]MCV0393337.1 amino acid permease [Nitrosopumilus sp.]
MSELKHHMGLFQLTMYGVGLILGAGIYVLIGEAAGFAGDAVWIAFVLGSIVALFAGFSYAELTSIFPKAAAEYVFIKNSFKNNFFAFVIGWLTAITSIITAATVALGFGGYFIEFVDIPIIISAIGLLVILSIVNFIGIRESAWTNTIFTIIEAAGLILIIIIGFTFANPEPVNYMESPTGISGIAIAFVLIFFAFIGFEDMANIAEEVKKPRKTLPRAIILSVIISGIIYILVSLAVVRVVNWEELATSSAPMAMVAERGLGSEAHIILSAIALFAITNTVLITLIAGSRIFYGMAKENVFPKILEKVHFKTKTPWLSIIVIMITSIIFTTFGDIVVVANITVFAIVITFAAVNLAVIVLRYTQPDIERKFKVPINIGKFPVLPLIGLIISGYMALQFDLEVVAVGIGIIVVGIIFYLSYGRRKVEIK